MSIARKSDIEKLNRELARNRPTPTVGMLTSQTTGGVTRRPINTSQPTTTKNTNVVARYG